MKTPIPEPCVNCIHRMCCCLVEYDDCKYFLSIKILDRFTTRELQELKAHTGQNLSLFESEAS